MRLINKWWDWEESQKGRWGFPQLEDKACEVYKS